MTQSDWTGAGLAAVPLAVAPGALAAAGGGGFAVVAHGGQFRLLFLPTWLMPRWLFSGREAL